MAFVEFFAASGVIALVVVEALGDVGQLGDEWAFTLYAQNEFAVEAFKKTSPPRSKRSVSVSNRA
jgi:hypothetical protein